MDEDLDQQPVVIKDLCRICTTDSDTLFPLIENGDLTEMGTMFTSCLHLNILSEEGYPDKLCNYCQLQLNMFHAFITKANKAHQTFTDIIETMQEDDQEEGDTDADDVCADSQIEVLGMSEEYDDDMIIKKENLDSESTYDISLVETLSEKQEDDSGNENAGDNESSEHYNVEYLDLEYIKSFEKELKNKNKMSEEVIKPVTKKKSATNKSKSSLSGSQNRRYPFECSDCSRRFVHREVYEGHLRVHEGLPAFSCPHCPKTFNEKPNFDYHMQNHNNHRPAQCSLCEKSFKNKQDLNSHLRVHNDIRKYMCDVCGRRFRSQSHMVYHRYTHFEERNFHCDQCPQSFKSPHILKTHKNTIHSDICRYECLECGKKFKRDHHLAAHKRTHQEDRPKKKKIKAKSEAAIVEYIDNMEECVTGND